MEVPLDTHLQKLALDISSSQEYHMVFGQVLLGSYCLHQKTSKDQQNGTYNIRC